MEESNIKYDKRNSNDIKKGIQLYNLLKPGNLDKVLMID